MQIIWHLWDHSMWLEWIWWLAACTGWSYAVWSFYRTRGDYHWTIAPGSEATALQKFFARIIFQAQKIFLLKHSLLLTIATLAIGLPPPPPDYSFLPQSIYSIGGITMLSILMMYQQIMSAIWRGQIESGQFREALIERLENLEKRTGSGTVVD